MSKGCRFTFFAVAAVVITLAAGCSSSSSAPPALGGAGESCTKTADCGSGLVCIADVCGVKGAPGVAAMDGGVVFSPDAAVVVPPPVDAGGAAPEAAPPPRVSDLGESCSSTSDCGAGLVCVPAVSGGGATCDVASYGLKPTGKTCSGECLTGADCCELPQSVVIGAKTCQDLLAALSGNTTQCASAVLGSDVDTKCFIYATYCAACATSNVWSCTSNQCVYSASCQNSGLEADGCPDRTRTGRSLSPFCDPATSKCQSSPRGICNTASDCDGKGTSDSAGTCRGGDCTCYQGGCYLACASTLDCAQGYACNTTSKLCTQNGACSSDAECASQTGVVNAKCVSGACKLPCTSDRQCGGSGLAAGAASDAGGFLGKVCGSDGFCDDLGCATDGDCQELGSNMNPSSNPVNFFCVTPLATTPTPAPASAITN